MRPRCGHSRSRPSAPLWRPYVEPWNGAQHVPLVPVTGLGLRLPSICCNQWGYHTRGRLTFTSKGVHMGGESWSTNPASSKANPNFTLYGPPNKISAQGRILLLPQKRPWPHIGTPCSIPDSAGVPSDHFDDFACVANTGACEDQELPRIPPVKRLPQHPSESTQEVGSTRISP